MTENEAIKKLNMLDEALNFQRYDADECSCALQMAIQALEKQIPKKVYHFTEDDTFETSCCGIDVSNEDFKYCPECGQLLGEVEEVREDDRE